MPRGGDPVPAQLILRDKTHEVRHGMTIRDALLKQGILPETVLPTRDGELLTDDVILKDGDVIKLVSVISGG
jgi:sulfur carrier protein ThiS